jgi:hypothetical protein
MKEFFKLLKAIVIDLFMSELNEQEVRLTIASNKNNAIKALSILEKKIFADLLLRCRFFENITEN